MQELFAKLTLSTFYVEAYLLVVFSFKFEFDASALGGGGGGGALAGAAARARIIAATEVGLVTFLAGQVCAFVALAALRLQHEACLLYTSPSPRDGLLSRMPSSA